MFLKNSLDATSTSLCTATCLKSSLTNVTSWRYEAFLNEAKDFAALLWKSFHSLTSLKLRTDSSRQKKLQETGSMTRLKNLNEVWWNAEFISKDNSLNLK